MTCELHLVGCRVMPLGSYLKGLGAFRLVAEQVDSAATCRWSGDVLVIQSRLDAADVVGFFLDTYEPSPVLTPWNSDAGFKPGTSKNTKALQAVEASDDPRFHRYRAAIQAVRRVMATPAWQDPAGGAAKGDAKQQNVTLLRNALPDDALDWLDAAVVLRPEGNAFPPLLGSGGGIGRLDLSPNFMERLIRLLDRSAKARIASEAWLRQSLFDEGSPELRKDSAGQYDPGSAGGVRAVPAGEGNALTNPWDFVLLTEGCLLWAAGVARRLGGATTNASIPFTVRGSMAGHAGGAAGETMKGEIWAPVWSRDLDLPSMRRLFYEGRISWAGRQAGSAVDAVRAINSLGVDAGVERFVRNVVANRLGQSPLAVPVSVHRVELRRRVRVLADLDQWTRRLASAARGDGAPQGLVAAARQVERAMFAAADGTPPSLQNVLMAVAEAEAQVARSARNRSEGMIRPVPWLDPEPWLDALDDGSPELRIATSLALGRDDRVNDARHGCLRFLLTPTTGVARGNDRFYAAEWSSSPAVVLGLGRRPADDLLTDVLVVRSRTERHPTADGRAGQPDGERSEGGVGVEPWFPSGFDVTADDAEALAGATPDVVRIGQLLPGLLLLRPVPWLVRHAWPQSEPGVSPAWRVLAPFFSRHLATVNGRPVRLRPLPTWAPQLAAGRVEDLQGVLREARTRLRMAGLQPLVATTSGLAHDPDPHLLAAALLVSPPRSAVQRALDSVIDRERSQQGELT